MSFRVEVQPSGKSFVVEEGESLLDAAIRQGVGLPYGCRNGICGSCKGKLISGHVSYAGTNPTALSDEEQEQRIGLFCQARPRSDLVIRAQLVGSGDEIVVRRFPCRVERLEPLCHDVMGVWLKLPGTERMQYLAGQYLDILLPDGRNRSFSIANAPHKDELIELHIRHIDGGDFTSFVFDQLKQKAVLRIEGPHGAFYLREDSNRPIICLAGGTGFAPIKGLIEHAIAEQSTRPIHLYWGARAKRDLYMVALAESWAEQYPHIQFIPVLSEPKAEDHWQGRTGYVHEAVLEDFTDLRAFEVYACGPPPMVYAGHAAFTAKGMAEDAFFSDAFEFQSTK